jgi:hypothetical protein
VRKVNETLAFSFNRCIREGHFSSRGAYLSGCRVLKTKEKTKKQQKKRQKIKRPLTALSVTLVQEGAKRMLMLEVLHIEEENRAASVCSLAHSPATKYKALVAPERDITWNRSIHTSFSLAIRVTLFML